MRKKREDEIWTAALPWVEDFAARLDRIAQPGRDMKVCTVVTETARDDAQERAGAVWMCGPTDQPDARMVADILVPVVRTIRAETGMSFDEILHRTAHELQMHKYDEMMRRCSEWDC